MKKNMIRLMVILSIFCVVLVMMFFIVEKKSKEENNFAKSDENGKESVRVEDMTKITEASYNKTTRSTVEVHDPSFVVGYIDENKYTGSEKVFGEQNEDGSRNKVYFVFGTHLSFAYSTDMENWTKFSNNLNTNYNEIFYEEKEWAAAGDSDYDLSSRMWAPDVLWNPHYKNDDGTIGAWTMYMSIDGVLYNSSIVLLTSDSLNGDWTYQGTVLYSGFTEAGSVHDYTLTDYLKYAELDEDETLPDRYIMPEYTSKSVDEATTWSKNWGGHAIDPAVFFDEKGTMYMVYGSFSGGIFMLEMDSSTGFRSKERIYEEDLNKADGCAADPYFGIKLSGGNNISVEGAYIKYINGKYYLFISVGGCNTDTGYNMRVFSSDNVEGEYKDITGNSAMNAGSIEGTVGSRFMFYYKWDWQKKAQLAQGHNSVYVDEEGNAFLVYHSKTNDGTWHYTVKIHQLFVTEGGHLVASPFEYSATDKMEASYSVSNVVGDYKVLYHTITKYANLAYNSTKNITLNEDGTITGDSKGTWTVEDDNVFVKLKINNMEYDGVFMTQTIEGTDIQTICFSAIGQLENKLPLWGVKLPEDEHCISLMKEEFSELKTQLSDGYQLQTEGNYGTNITWYSEIGIISDENTIIASDEEQKVNITAFITKGEYCYIKEYENITIEARK